MPTRFRPMRVLAQPVVLLAFASVAAAQAGSTSSTRSTLVAQGTYVTSPASGTRTTTGTTTTGTTTTGTTTTGTTTTGTTTPPPEYTTTSTTTTSTTTDRTASRDQQRGRGDNARLRIGVEVGLGPILGHTTGLQIAVIGQLGIQFSNWWAIYYAPSLLIGGAGASDGIAAFVATGQLGYLALHPTKHLEIDGGGGVAIGYDACSASKPCGSGNHVDGVVSGRLALNLGFRSVRARLGIPLAVHYYGTFLDNGQMSHALMFTIGFLRY